MNGYQNHYIGEPVSIVDNHSNFIFAGIITKLGTLHAVVNERDTGYNHDVVYDMIQKKGAITKTAQAEIIKEDEQDGKKFILSKDETNIDGKLSVKYEVTVDGESLWESEEIVTNVYDVEKGWSAPDDFDENKLDLIQQTAESGFDMLVQSYTNVRGMIESEMSPTEGEGEPGAEDTPEGKPAFAPGEGPDSAAAGGGSGGGAVMLDGEEGDVIEGESAEGEDVDGEAGGDEAGGVEPFAEEPVEEVISASLGQSSFSRSILAGKQGDDRLHGNPQHRLNPALREEMARKGIDSGNTNDLELSDKLKDFDYSKSKKA